MGLSSRSSRSTIAKVPETYSDMQRASTAYFLREGSWDSARRGLRESYLCLLLRWLINLARGYVQGSRGGIEVADCLNLSLPVSLTARSNDLNFQCRQAEERAQDVSRRCYWLGKYLRRAITLSVLDPKP